MIVPVYKKVPRSSCKMLTLAWERRWESLVRRCESFPSEAFCVTEHSGRTALHLSTFNQGCPIEVARAILKSNRHSILVADYLSYTPLHNISLFQGGDALMPLFCDTAIMVEQELQGRGNLPPPFRTSPLYLAAKRNAPLSTLRTLLKTRARSKWIAPFTGGESYWNLQEEILDICSSPLEILVRGRTASFAGISEQTKQQMRIMSLELRKEVISSTTSWESEGDIHALDKHDKEALRLWAKCLLLMKENVRTIPAKGGSTSDIISLVHTIASLRVPTPFLLQLAAELFPEQIVQRDDTGSYPLFHVLKANHPYATKQLLNILLTKKESRGHHFPLPYIQECMRTAIHIGMSWEGGLKDIVMANSEVLTLTDSGTNLLPVFLAASQDAAIDTIFYLLREEPQAVTSC